MDDMVFQNNNKNAIYVLNASCDTYGEFRRPNITGYTQAEQDGNCGTNSRSCSVNGSLHKFKSVRDCSREMVLGDGSLTAESNSISTTFCSPAATALQKLFNCSSTSHSCSDISHKSTYNNCQSSYQLNQNLSQHHHIYSQAMKQQYLLQSQFEHHHLENQIPSSYHSHSEDNNMSRPSCVFPCIGYPKKMPSSQNNFTKSTLTAKKKKFWKYLLAEEKWRKCSADNLSTNSCESDLDRGGAESYPPIVTNSRSCIGSSVGFIYHNKNADLNRSNNQKLTAELYKEATQLLGLSCTLCDNCRCLDCQSRYFECDDSDSYSELSLTDEYFEPLTDDEIRSHNLGCGHTPLLGLQQTQEEDEGEPANGIDTTKLNLEDSPLVHRVPISDLSLPNTESED